LQMESDGNKLTRPKVLLDKITEQNLVSAHPACQLCPVPLMGSSKVSRAVIQLPSYPSPSEASTTKNRVCCYNQIKLRTKLA
jgi:hypothetical protein